MALVTIFAWLCCGLTLTGLIVEIVNLFDFPVLVPGSRRGEDNGVVACVAMRDAERDARGCVEALLAQPELHAVIICDDHSTDGTASVIRELAREEPRVVALSLGDSEGKSAALAASARTAVAREARLLFFTDADVRLQTGAIASLIAYAEAQHVEAVSAWPRIAPATSWDGVFAQALVIFLLQALPLRIARRTRDPRFAAANGQALLIERQAYEHSGGHAACEGIVEDVALARLLKKHGGQIALASGARIASSAGYGGMRANVDGYGRSLRYGAGRPGALIFGLWQLIAFFAPWLLFAYAFTPAAIGVVALLIVNLIVAQRMRSGLAWLLSAPIGGAIVGTAAIWCAVRSGRFVWRGRRV